MTRMERIMDTKLDAIRETLQQKKKQLQIDNQFRRAQEKATRRKSECLRTFIDEEESQRRFRGKKESREEPSYRFGLLKRREKEETAQSFRYKDKTSNYMLRLRDEQKLRLSTEEKNIHQSSYPSGRGRTLKPIFGPTEVRDAVLEVLAEFEAKRANSRPKDSAINPTEEGPLLQPSIHEKDSDQYRTKDVQTQIQAAEHRPLESYEVTKPTSLEPNQKVIKGIEADSYENFEELLTKEDHIVTKEQQKENFEDVFSRNHSRSSPLIREREHQIVFDPGAIIDQEAVSTPKDGQGSDLDALVSSPLQEKPPQQLEQDEDVLFQVVHEVWTTFPIQFLRPNNLSFWIYHPRGHFLSNGQETYAMVRTKPRAGRQTNIQLGYEDIRFCFDQLQSDYRGCGFPVDSHLFLSHPEHTSKLHLDQTSLPFACNKAALPRLPKPPDKESSLFQSTTCTMLERPKPKPTWNIKMRLSWIQNTKDLTIFPREIQVDNHSSLRSNANSYAENQQVIFTYHQWFHRPRPPDYDTRKGIEKSHSTINGEEYTTYDQADLESKVTHVLVKSLPNHLRETQVREAQYFISYFIIGYSSTYLVFDIPTSSIMHLLWFLSATKGIGTMEEYKGLKGSTPKQSTISYQNHYQGVLETVLCLTLANRAEKKFKPMPRIDGPFKNIERIKDNAYKHDPQGKYKVCPNSNDSDLVSFFADLRTNPFQEEGDDVIMDNNQSKEHDQLGKEELEAKEHGPELMELKDEEPLHIPSGPMTRARAKEFMSKVNGLLQQAIDQPIHLLQEGKELITSTLVVIKVRD